MPSLGISLPFTGMHKWSRLSAQLQYSINILEHETVKYRQIDLQ